MTVPSATSRTNEAAERLLSLISVRNNSNADYAEQRDLLDAALSEERRLTLDAIREQLRKADALIRDSGRPSTPDYRDGWLDAIEEVATSLSDEVAR